MRKIGFWISAFVVGFCCSAHAQMVHTTVVNAPLSYSSDQYPTAQGHYLMAPVPASSTVTQGSVRVAEQTPVLIQAPTPQPAYVAQPMYVPPPATPAPAPYIYTRSRPTTTAAPAPPPVQNASAYAPMGVGTIDGFEFGVQGSDYHYQEHVVADQTFMHLDGWKLGLTADANKVFSDGTFITGQSRFAYGLSNYTGGDVNLFTHATIPSKHKDERDLVLEGRVLAGHDFLFNNRAGNFAISPYAGLGIRYLYNDGTGEDTNGVQGYKRYSHYLYFPVGVTPRLRISDDARISLNGEYDHLLYGWQESDIAAPAYGTNNLNNNQYGGYGVRGSLMYERTSWSIGPFFNYWNINQSASGQAITVIDGSYYIISGNEPHNQTVEAGLQLRYRLDMGW